MEFTGERFLPELSGDIELEHVHRYLLAAELVGGKRVLDIASGEGYGTSVLARSAAHVVGVDIDSQSVEHARQQYPLENIEFFQGDCASIPVPDDSIDVVVSFETIEHHDAHEAMMAEIKRVLSPGGLLIISSPDKAEYSDKPGFTNAFHVKELYADEFEQLLGRYFKHIRMQGQRVLYGSLIAGIDAPGFVSYRNETGSVHRSVGSFEAIYLLAFASDNELPDFADSFYSTDNPPFYEDANRVQAEHQAEHRAMIDKLEQVRKELDAERELTAKVAAEKQQLQSDLAQTRASTSWRCTAPLRAVSTLFKSIRR